MATAPVIALKRITDIDANITRAPYFMAARRALHAEVMRLMYPAPSGAKPADLGSEPRNRKAGQYYRPAFVIDSV
jgi:hypothetical protein